jgi:hypothetical protein
VTNLTELKKLAEAAAAIDHNEHAEWYTAECIESQGAYYPKNARFIAKANPQAILQMIAVMEQMAGALEYGFVDDPSQHKERDALAAYSELTA